MVNITRGIAAALILVGVVAVAATQTPTAAAPAAIGLLMLVFGILAGRENLRQHMIHAALVVALLGLLSSAMPLMSLPDLLRGEAERPVAPITGGLMALLCLVYLVLGVRSFIAAKRERELSA